MADIARGKELARRVFTEGMGQGRTEVVDECLAATAVDHQHSEIDDARAHLKDVIRGLHTAFPDLQSEVTHLVGDGDTVAIRVTYRGTHDGPLQMPGMPRAVPPTGRNVAFEQFHVITVGADGRGVHHWGADGADEVRRQLGMARSGVA